MGSYSPPTSVKFPPSIKEELQAVADNMSGDSRGSVGAVIKVACMEYLIRLRLRQMSYADLRRLCPIESILPGSTKNLSMLPGSTKHSQVIPIDSPENITGNSSGPRVRL